MLQSSRIVLTVDFSVFQHVILFLSWYVNECLIHEHKHIVYFLSGMQYNHNHITDDECKQRTKIIFYPCHTMASTKFLVYTRELLVAIYVTVKLILTQT